MNHYAQGKSALSMVVDQDPDTYACFPYYYETCITVYAPHGDIPPVTTCTPHYDVICEETYGGPLPGTGGGGGGPVGGETGGGNSSSDITNEIDDPCLKQTIDKALTYSASAVDLISDIIKELDGNVGLQIDINVVDGITPQGKPGEANMTLTKVNGIPTEFTGTIVLHEAYMPDVSQEGAVAIFIHEVIHAYLIKADLINDVNDHFQHDTMAAKYVAPMASYLQGLFGISEFEAFSLAWSGLSDSNAYKNVLSFEIGDTSYSKNTVEVAGANYKGRGADGNLLAGMELCDD